MAETLSPAMPATISKEERNWAMLSHLSGLLAFATLIGGVLGPLVMWMIRKDDMNFAADQAKEALNFQITVIIAMVVAIILMMVTLGLLFFVPMIVGLGALVLCIMAAIKVNEGVAYRYPFALRLIK